MQTRRGEGQRLLKSIGVLCSRCRPVRRKHLSLLQYRQRCVLLLVRWVSVLPQDALHEHTQVSPDILADSPVDGGISAYCIHKLTGNRLERSVTENFDCAV